MTKLSEDVHSHIAAELESHMCVQPDTTRNKVPTPTPTPATTYNDGFAR
jgi:hypothetical protein